LETFPVPDTRDENGWPVYEMRAEGFAVSLPPNWRQIDHNPAAADARRQQVLKQNPEYTSTLGDPSQHSASGIKFEGMDPVTVGSVNATKVNVLHVTLPSEASLDTIVVDFLRKLESLPNIQKPFTHERIESATGSRERVVHKMTMKNAAGIESTLAMTPYIAVRGRELYVKTLATPPEQESEYASAFDQIGRSFRLVT